ncbi:unnamed protein product, partial [marine sediment metagenome]
TLISNASREQEGEGLSRQETVFDVSTGHRQTLRNSFVQHS